MGINYKGSQGQTERAIALQEEEEDKHYCNILFKVIKEAKKCHYSNQIKNSTNKNKINYLSSHSTVLIVLISNNFRYFCTYMVLLFYCDLSYAILNIRLYIIANITLRSYITIRMLPIYIILKLTVLYLISFVTLFLY